MNEGYVYLVGAGPGDIRLLTVKGKQCLEKADVILYDRLVNPLLLEVTKPGAEMVYCGKLPDRHLLRQEAINDLLVKYAQEGKNVVRLKGGDPSVYGRVGEEAAALEEAGISYEIVPGITASIGASTYAGVPVTHRDYGASFAIVTGHDKSPTGQPIIDWKGLATGIDTIAFYMGVKNLPYICEQLIHFGRDPKTPVLLVQWGTVGKQKTLSGDLETIADLVKKEKFSNPAITLVGQVAKLRTKESWFERQPLFGEHILFGRTTEGASEIANELVKLGADVFEYPRFVTKHAKLEQSISFSNYDQIIFHSPKSVQWFFAQLKMNHIDIRSIQAQLFGASKKSRREIESFACSAFPVQEMMDSNKRLVVGSTNWSTKEQKRNELYGDHDFVVSHVDEIIEQSNFTCQRILDEDRVDTIVFPSAEAVKVVTDQIATLGETPSTLCDRAKIICFGSESKKAAEDLGYRVDFMMNEPSKDELIQIVKDIAKSR
ncbi:uroporphyrinogen-III methyltransferase [Halalkalibacter wakoensis JCM 9140]|uniref:Uroporphyrinogen-III C-methyltransferase n=1 Tax=Halalkalibacter wakoensis JCM 9140 TaxID=1236970 RepID=W4PZB0_9BACI|nr:uroporphyrinogen-III C-methyltransferase [Halalkalibacter wakoensis]GAE24828.1 uroporphyrinogen-III methyltransferase [Halalkalibacter wakoensis JCM 9140]